MTICGIFAHLPHFTFFIAYLPYDHHMSVTHGVANMQSAKKSVVNVQISRGTTVLLATIPQVVEIIESCQKENLASPNLFPAATASIRPHVPLRVPS
jgi:hypothetical protein